MDPLLLAILITFAIRQAVENGKAEYAHVRDRRAAELARTYPNWSQGRIKRVARRAARGYWWNQIRRGFPEVRAAYAENKDLAEAARIEAETAGLKRRVEVRERIRKALKEAEEIREKERQREAGGDGASAAGPEAKKPEAAEPAPKATDEPPANPETPAAQEAPEEAGPVPDTAAAADAPASEKLPDPVPATAWACSLCSRSPARYRPGRGHLCDRCWDWIAANAEPEAAEPRPDTTDTSGGDEPGATIIPLKPPPAPAAAPSTPTEGDRMTVPTGEYTGFEAAVANWNAIAQLSQQLQTHYEQLMAQYRAMNVDDQTIGRAATCSEAEEQHLIAVQAARNDFVSRHGAVKETKDSTGARGDEAVYTS